MHQLIPIHEAKDSVDFFCKKKDEYHFENGNPFDDAELPSRPKKPKKKKKAVPKKRRPKKRVTKTKRKTK